MVSGKKIKFFLFNLSCAVLLLLYLFLVGKLALHTAILLILFYLVLHIWIILKSPVGIKLLFASIYTLYLTLEIITYLLICGQYLRPDFYSVVGSYLGASDRPYAHFDSISGYKYTSGITRLVNVYEHHLVYDIAMHVNGRGYPSIYEYPYAKKNKKIKRFMVFGDSFSAGEITDTTWVDLLNKKIETSPDPHTEFFNFSLEAIGIRNWQRIFFGEVVPHYEFDGIVLAVVGDLNYYSSDLIRPFAIKNSERDYTVLNFFETLPSSQAAFDSGYKQQLYYESSIYPSTDLDNYKALALCSSNARRHFSLMTFRPYLLHFVADAFHFIRKRNSFMKRYSLKKTDATNQNALYNDWESYEQYYGAEKTGLIKSILDYCNVHHKEIWIISIPSFNIATADPVHYRNNIYNKQLRFLATQYHAQFYDGYELIDHITPEHYNDFHLYCDTHWNRKGIDLFLSLLPMK